MTICKFYLEGRCTYGSKCKYEHRQPNSSELNNRISWNNSYNQSQAFEEKSIRTDLTKERPPWPYTVYAPAKEEPNLIEGTDISPEELRFEFLKLKDFWMYGGEMQYNQGVSQLNSIMKQKTDDVLKDMRNTMRTYQNKTRQQSGFYSSNTLGGSQRQSNAFGSNSGFGQPQQSGAFSQQQSGFGSSGFGRQQQGGFRSNGFGQQRGFSQQQPLQSSPFGQQPGPGFRVTQQNGGPGGFYQQQQQQQQQQQPQPQPQQTGFGLGTPPQSNTFGTLSSIGNPPAPTFGQTGFGSVPNTQQQNPLGQSIQNPFGTQQQPSLYGGGMQGAKPDGMSEYFTGQVPTSPPPNHY